MAAALLPLFCHWGPPAILQSGNGRKFCNQASDSSHIAIDNDVSFIVISKILVILILDLNILSIDYLMANCVTGN